MQDSPNCSPEDPWVHLAFAGTGYAAATIGTSEIKDGAATNKKIRKHTIKKSRLAFNPQGARGATGPRGATAGAVGAAGGVNYNARLSAGATTSKTVGAFTLSTSANGAANCGTTTISSGTTDAHFAFNGGPVFTGTALNGGNGHSVNTF